MRIYALLTLLPFICLSVACAVRAPEHRTGLLQTQLDEDWKYWMTQYPEVATPFGYPGQNPRWTDYSPSAIDGRARYLKGVARRLTASRRATLGVTHPVN